MQITERKKIPDPTKAKENYKLFLKHKEKQIHKTSNNGDIKSVPAKHPKTASNSLKPVEKSNIITQEIKTVEKPNILNIESVNIEHPKTPTKLSKSIKQTKVITQQLKRQGFIQSQKPLTVRYS